MTFLQIAASSFLSDAFDASLKYIAVAGAGSLLSQFLVGRRLGKKIDENDKTTRTLISAVENRQSKIESEMSGPRGVQQTLDDVSVLQKKDHDLLIAIGTKMEAFTQAVDSFRAFAEGLRRA